MPEMMLPEGVEIPDGTMPGDEFELLARVKLMDGGKAELVALDGKTIAGYESNGEEEEEGGEEEMEAKPAPGGATKGRGRFMEAALAGVPMGGGMMG